MDVIPTTLRPTVPELIEAVREHLAAAAVTPPPPYLHRVAANVLAIVERELAAGRRMIDVEQRECGRLGVADPAQLAAAIRNGDFDTRAAELLPALAAMVDAQLAIDNPKYAAPKGDP